VKKEESINDVLKRLAKIEGQVRGLSRMIGEGRSCEEVVNQIQAVKAGISKVAIIILEQNVTECLSVPLDNDDEKLNKLKRLLVKIAGG
jgi:DNA-binding FrmR family transcriptional regulator